MKNYETLLIERMKPVLKISFNRPDKANAMNDQMMDEIDQIISELRNNSEYKFVIFTGNGRVFSGGADMKEVMSKIESNGKSPLWIRNDQLKRQEFMRKFDALDQVTIAMINGPMYGAGFALAMVCDFRIMAESATACLPEVERGLFFSGGGTPRLVNLIGPAKAKELIMTGDVIYSEEALRIGLVNKVVPDNELSNAVEDLIRKLNKSPFSPIRLTKKIVNATTLLFDNLLMYEPELQEQVLMHGEAREEINKYIQKSIK